MSLEDLFYDVDEFCRLFLTAWHRQLLTGGTRQRRRTSRSILGEIMTILTVEMFLRNRPEVLRRILVQANAPPKDAAAVNAARWALANWLKVRWPVVFESGGQTKFNRTRQGHAKDRWIDAACVGESGERATIRAGFKPLDIAAKDRGTRQMVRANLATVSRAAKPAESSEYSAF